MVESTVKAISRLAPDLEVVREDDDRGLVRIIYQCRQYSVHSIHGKQIQDQYQTLSRQVLGPGPDGFIVELQWYPALGGGAGTSRPMYWHVGSRCARLAKNGFVCATIHCGRDVDAMALQDLVTDTLSQFGTIVSPPTPEWTEKSANLRQSLQKVLLEFGLQSEWRVTDNQVTCESQIMQFDVHTVDSEGKVSPTPQKVAGPNRNGLIIRLRPVKAPLPGASSPVCGLRKMPYWDEYFAICDEGENSFEVEILYGETTDRRMLKELAESLNASTSRYVPF